MTSIPQRLLISLLLMLSLAVPASAQARRTSDSALPRFTEEREAAALFFVRKHLPELVPLLEELKKNDPNRYERQVREIFQVTEILTDLRDEPRRHELELKIWKFENRAFLLIGKLATPNEEERRKLEGQLQQLARELIDLDVQVLEWKSETLERELGEIKDELARLRENPDRQARERYDTLLDQVKRRRK